MMIIYINITINTKNIGHKPPEGEATEKQVDLNTGQKDKTGFTDYLPGLWVLMEILEKFISF